MTARLENTSSCEGFEVSYRLIIGLSTKVSVDNFTERFGKFSLGLMILYDLSIPAGIMSLVSNCSPILINRISIISSADKLPLLSITSRCQESITSSRTLRQVRREHLGSSLQSKSALSSSLLDATA